MGLPRSLTVAGWRRWIFRRLASTRRGRSGPCPPKGGLYGRRCARLKAGATESKLTQSAIWGWPRQFPPSGECFPRAPLRPCSNATGHRKSACSPGGPGDAGECLEMVERPRLHGRREHAASPRKPRACGPHPDARRRAETDLRDEPDSADRRRTAEEPQSFKIRNSDGIRSSAPRWGE